MESEPALHTIPDDELLRRLGELVSHSRRVEADLVAHIGEVDERRLYAREASPSMCPENLRLLCPVHNRYLAESDYGQAAIRRHRRLEKEAPA